MKLNNKYLFFIFSTTVMLFFYFINNFNFGFLVLSFSFIYLFYSVLSNPNLFKVLISLLLFLGIWVKYFVRSLLTPGEFNDPVGSFIYTQENVSEIFIYVAIIISFIALIFSIRLKLNFNKKFNFEKIKFSYKYQLLIVILIFTLLILNFILKIDYRGLNTHYSGFHIYIYKYVMQIFAPIFIFTYADNFHNKNKYQFPFLCIFLFIYALSLNSRSFVFEGLFLIIYFIIKYKDLFNLKKYLIFFFIYIVLALSNFYYVNNVRYTSFLTDNNLSLSSSSDLNDVKNYVIKTSLNVGYYSLFIDRWVGLEPIFAIYSFPNRSNFIFVEALLETKDSDISFYDTYIIKDSTYLLSNNNNIFNHNIPGIIGFSLYSDNIIISLLFIGLFFSIICIMFNSIQTGIFSSYIISFIFAWRISHFGYAPMYTFFYFVLIFLTYYIINKFLLWKK
jgi:hypothetical protein